MHVHTQKCYALECEGEDDSVIIEMDGVTISTDASYLMINDRFEADGVEYKEIGPEKAQLWDASGVSGEFVVPDEVENEETGEYYKVVSVSPGAFAGNKKLTGITMGAVFEEVEGNLFEGCSKLSDVIIEDITVIGDGWFKGSGVKTITGDITEIGDSAFENCDKLVEATFLDSVEVIGDYAFADCEKLKDVEFGDSVLTIGTQAFASCSSLKEIEIPATVTIVGQKAFLDCTNLQSVVIGDSRVQSSNDNMVIGAEAFVGCESLETVDIQSSVVKISEKAFYYCDELSFVSLPDSLKIIEDSAFEYCDSLVNVKFGTSPETAQLESIGVRAFCHSGITSVYNYDNSEFVIIPLQLPNKLKVIESRAFSECYSLCQVIFGSSQEDSELETIGIGAFYDSGLGEVEIYNSETGEWEYIDCPLLLPNSLETIEDYAFYRCSYLKTIVFGTSQTAAKLESIGVGAFSTYSGGQYSIRQTEQADEDSSDVMRIVLPDSLKSIGAEAFYCSPVQDVQFGSGLESIGDSAFAWSSTGGYYDGSVNLKNITIQLPDELKTIGNSAFAGCYNLGDVRFGTSKEDAKLVSIGTNAFYSSGIYGHTEVDDDYEKFTILELPDSLKTIGDNAFSDCYKLNRVEFGTSMKVIGKNAFYGCRSLYDVNFDDSEVYSIGDYAFYDSGLKEISLPNSLTKLGYDAFLFNENSDSKPVGTVNVLKKEIGNLVAAKKSWNYNLEIKFGEYTDFDGSGIDKDATAPVDPGLDSGENMGSSDYYYYVGEYLYDYSENMVYEISGVEPNTVKFVNRYTENRSIENEYEEWQYLSLPEEYGHKEDYWSSDAEVTSTWAVTGIGQVSPYSNVYVLMVPATVIEMDEEAFYGHYYLKAISFAEPDEDAVSVLTEIPDRAFKDCQELAQVELPSTITTIGEEAFSGCLNLKSIELPENLTTIGAGAFKDCTGLESITIPASVTEISESAFEGCTSLESIIFEETDITTGDEGTGITIGDRAFYGSGCEKITSLEIPETVVAIGKQAFDACPNLTSVHIEGDGLQKLGVNAFPKQATVTAESPRIQLLLVEYLDFKEGVLPETTWNGEKDLEPGAIVTLDGTTIKATTIGRNANVYIPAGTTVEISNNLQIERDAIIYVMEGATLSIASGVTVNGLPVQGIQETEASGEGTLYVEGTITCSGTIGDYITIYAALRADMVEDVADVVYTGKAIEPTPTVALDMSGSEWSYDAETDFTYSYSKNISVGTATVTITPIEDGSLLGGSVSKTFNITKASADMTIESEVSGDTATLTAGITKNGAVSVTEFTSREKVTFTVTNTSGNGSSVRTVWIAEAKETNEAEVECKLSGLYNGTYTVTAKYGGDSNHEETEISATFEVTESTVGTSTSGGSSSGSGSTSSGGGSTGTTGGTSGGTATVPPVSADSDEDKIDYGLLTLDPVKGLMSSIYGILPANYDNHRSKWEIDEISAIIWGGDINNYWKLQYMNGTYAKGSKVTDENGNTHENYHWEFINGKWWAFDSQGFAKIGWLYDENYKGWFYIHIKHGMQTGWIYVGNKWYYMNPESNGYMGKMFAASWTPDGYYVKEDGAWDGMPQVQAQ